MYNTPQSHNTLQLTTHNYLKTLFNIDEHTCVGNLYSTVVKPVTDLELSEFISINPLQSDKTRADCNVSHFRNFLFEIDDIDLETQYTMLSSIDIFSAITYSGGKSYHALICLEQPLNIDHRQYKLLWTKLAAKISSLLKQPKNIFDSACKNPSRFSRMPGFRRSNGNIQTLQFLSARKSKQFIEQTLQISNLEECIQFHPADCLPKPVTDYTDIYTVDQFKSVCDTPLWYKITNVPFAAPSNAYHEMYRMTLWAIDCTNVSKELYYQVMEEYTFPILLAAGYPEEKLHVAIEHAYRAKDRA